MNAKRPSTPSSRGAGTSARKGPRSAPTADTGEPGLVGLLGSLGGLTAELTSSALRFANLTRDTANKAIRRSPEQLRMMASAGESLRDLREVAGLTITEVADALDLRDKSVLQAIEDGREVMSIELILRLASLVARNDPLPFVLRFTRVYYPRLWEMLAELNLDQLPLQFERERQFLNIYRRHDKARKLSDEDFTKVLTFTQHAFDMAIHFVSDNGSSEPKAPSARRTREQQNERPKRPSKRSARGSSTKASRP